MAFPIIPIKRSGAAGNPSSLNLGELAVNTLTGELFLGADAGVTLLNGPVSAGTTVTEATGDGTSVAFTFSGYNGTADGGYLVSIGGIDQPPSTYSISATAGGTITFSSAPTVGELISIRAIVAGAGGSGTGIGGRAWSPTETYTEGDLVATSQSETWICIQNSNTGNDPATSPTWWDKMPANAVTLQGRPFSGEAPDQYMSLTWVTDAWMPSFTVELAGTPLVYPFEPTDGQVLGYDGAISKWKPVPASAGVNASLLQGTAIAPEPNPNALEVLTWAQISSTGGGDFAWRPRPLGGSGTPTEGQGLVFNATNGWIAGDVNAFKIRSQTVVTTSPATNEALVYNGSDWAPAAVNAVQLQGQPVSSAAPVTNNLLKFDGTNWAPFDGLAIPSWNVGVSYIVADRVWHDGKIWASVTAGSGQTPSTGSTYWAENLGSNSGTPVNQSTPAYWLRITTPAGDGHMPIYV